MKLLALVVGCGVAGLACGTYGSEPLPLAITVQADKLDTLPGDSVTFNFNAQGGRLDFLRVDWGDGTTFDESALSARTMSRRVKHVYDAAGTYKVRATINDSFSGQKSDSLSVRIR